MPRGSAAHSHVSECELVRETRETHTYVCPVLKNWTYALITRRDLMSIHMYMYMKCGSAASTFTWVYIESETHNSDSI